MAFLGIGTPELAVIAVVVVLLFGASQIPKLARSLGQARAEFGKARREFETEVAKGEAGAASPIPAASAALPSASVAPGAASDEQVRQTAAALGIATDGKSNAELKLLIQQRLA